MTIPSTFEESPVLPWLSGPAAGGLHSKLPLYGDKERGLTIGVDLGGTNLRIAGFTPRLDFLAGLALPTDAEEGPEAVVLNMCNAIRRVRERCGKNRELIGIGIGSPGPLELPAGKLRHPPNLPGFDGFLLKRAIEEELGESVIVESDANAAALAEWNSGAGQVVPDDSLCMLTLGTGIGSGIILEGKIWHGMIGMGGEAGHLPLVPDGLPCGCGGRGCLEQYASATAVLRAARGVAKGRGASEIAKLIREKKDAGARDLADLARAGDKQSIALFLDVGKFLGKGLASLVNILDLRLYVLGGGMIEAWDLFAPRMFEELASLSYIYRLTQPADPRVIVENKTYILPAVLGSDAGILGAAMLPLVGGNSSGPGQR
jgi:glucokinase